MANDNEITIKAKIEPDESSARKAGEKDASAYSKGFEKRLAAAKSIGGQWWTDKNFSIPHGKPKNMEKFVDALRLTKTQQNLLSKYNGRNVPANLKEQIKLAQAQQKAFDKYFNELDALRRKTAHDRVDRRVEKATKAQLTEKRKDEHRIQEARKEHQREVKATEKAAEKAAVEERDFRQATYDASFGQRVNQVFEDPAYKYEQQKLAQQYKEQQKLRGRGVEEYIARNYTKQGVSDAVLSERAVKEIAAAYGADSAAGFEIALKNMAKDNVGPGKDGVIKDQVIRETIQEAADRAQKEADAAPTTVYKGWTKALNKLKDYISERRKLANIAKLESTVAKNGLMGPLLKGQKRPSEYTQIEERYKELLKKRRLEKMKATLADPDGKIAQREKEAEKRAKEREKAREARAKARAKKRGKGFSLFDRFFYGEERRGIEKIPLVGTLAKVAKKVKSLGGQMARAFRFRLIRLLMQNVIRLAKEGLQNLNEYSKVIGTPFHTNVTELASSLMYLKNAFAAMVGPLVNYVTPALTRLMDLIAMLANKVGAFFAAITGQQQFSAAMRYVVKDAQGAANKLKDILGFDEINRLSGDSGGGASYEKMFEEWNPTEGVFGELNDMIQNGQWKALGIKFAEKVNSLINSFDAEAFGKKLGTKFDNAFQVLGGFISKLNTSELGAKVAGFLNGGLNSIDWNNIGTTIAGWSTKMFDYIIGMFTNIKWADVGKSISGLLMGAMKTITDWFTEKDWNDIGYKLGTGIADMIKNLKLADLISAFAGMLKAVFSGAWGLAKGVLEGLFEKFVPPEIQAKIKSDWETFKSNIDKKFKDWSPKIAAVLGIELESSSLTATLEKVKDLLKLALDIAGLIAAILGQNVASLSFWGGKTADDIINMLAERINSLNPTPKGTYTPTNYQTNTTQSSGKYSPQATQTVSGSYIIKNNGGGRQSIKSSLYASGGYPDKGDLFIADEAGPELIGTINGKTAVTNQDQFTQGLYDANRDVVAGLADVVRAINNKNMSVELDGREIARNTTKWQNNTSRRFGMEGV